MSIRARLRKIEGVLPRGEPPDPFDGRDDVVRAELARTYLAGALAAEFARLATSGELDEGYEEYEDDHGAGPMGFGADRGGSRRRSGGKMALGIAVLTVIAVIGAVIGVKALTSSPEPGPTSPHPAASGSSTGSPNGGQPIVLKASQVRIVDPPGGDRTEFEGFEQVVDDLA